MRGAGGAVSARSIGALAFLARMLPIVISLPTMTPSIPHQSVWIAGVIGVALAVPMIWAMAAIGARDPQKSLLAQSRDVLGAWPCAAIGIVLCAYWVITAATFLKAMSQAYLATALHSTPSLAIVAPLAVLSATIARRGIGLICALADLIAPVVMAVVALIIGLPHQSSKLINLRPLLPQGLSALTAPALTTTSFFALASVAWMIIPRCAEARQGGVRRWLLIAVAGAGVLAVGLMAVVAAVFGPLSSTIGFPLYSVTRFISIGRILERLEILPMGFWVFAAGTVVAGLYWAAAQALGEVVQVERSGIFVYPLATVSIALAETMFPRVMVLSRFMSLEGWGAFSLALVIAIMAVMAIAWWARRRRAARALVSIAAIAILSILASGCWDRREIETLGFVVACALDTADAGAQPEDAGFVQVTVQIVKPWAIGTGERAGSPERAFYTVTAVGSTVYEAVRSLNEQSPRTPYWPHSRWIIIGEGLARAGVESVFDFFVRNREPRELPVLGVLDGGRGWDLMWVEFELERLPSTGGEGVINGVSRNLGTIVRTTLGDFLISLADPGVDPVLPRIVIVAHSDEPAATGDLLREKIRTTAEMSGAGVFRGDRLAGWLTGVETRGLNWVRGDVISAVIAVPAPGAEDPGDFRNRVSLEIMRASSQVSVRALNTTDEVEARVKVDVTAHLAETRSFVDISQDMQALIQMEEALADQIRGEILDAVQKAQSLGADIFGFGRMLMASDYRAWKRICPKWDTVFTSLPVKVEVKARIDRSAFETNRYEADTTK